MHGFVMGVWAWLSANPLVGGGLAVVVLLMLWKQPKQTLKLAIALAVLVALGYLVSGIIDFTMDSAAVKSMGLERNQ
jgi:hypothetical protein